MTKAKKVEPAQDMDAHNAAIRDAEANPPEETTDAEPKDVAVLTTAEVAEQLDTTPRTLRKFLRSKGSGIEPVGQGKRYALTAQSLPKLTERFDAWSAKANARAAEAEEADGNDTEIEEIEAEVEEFEEISYDPDTLTEMTVKELRALCEEYGIDAPAKAKKAELVELLS